MPKVFSHLAALAKLKAICPKALDFSLKQLFAADKQRFDDFSIEDSGLLLDYSKNLIDRETLALLHDLAEQAQVGPRLQALFAGDKLNSTEQRPALHSLLRCDENKPTQMPMQSQVLAERQRMLAFAQKLRQGQVIGVAGEPINTVVNIGVGGSDLGPLMALQALHAYNDSKLNIHFVSCMDGQQLVDLLQHLQPWRTLFIVSSKSFATADTAVNADTAKNWLKQHFAGKKLAGSAFMQHFAAVSANNSAMDAFGIAKQQQFHIWPWVGGRYSLWSSIGLPLAIGIGAEKFQQFLAGARQMDQHVQHAPPSKNMPLIMALLNIWYSTFLGFATQAILPYSHRLRKLPAYLQQLTMESNGKSIALNGEKVQNNTAPITWGEVGTNAQHAFFQLLHQGTQRVPVDFIVFAQAEHQLDKHHQLTLANCLAQSRALMLGQGELQNLVGLTGLDLAQAQRANHQCYFGNRPSTTLIFDQLNPKSVGMLLALYEHRVFIESVIWGINPFDQWGVELGKKLALTIEQQMINSGKNSPLDSSSAGLLAFYRRHQK